MLTYVIKLLDKAETKRALLVNGRSKCHGFGIPVPTIDVAVSMREISALKDERLLPPDKLFTNAIAYSAR